MSYADALLGDGAIYSKVLSEPLLHEDAKRCGSQAQDEAGEPAYVDPDARCGSVEPRRGFWWFEGGIQIAAIECIAACLQGNL